LVMLIDARELPPGHLLHAQVCIVGSGLVGCALAQVLVGKGLQVVVLEAGDRTYIPAAQAEFWSEAVRSPACHPPLQLWRRRMLGGASTVWGGRCLPFSPSDFDGWGSRWPIDYAEYASYLPRAAHFLELGVSDFDARLALMPEARTFLGSLSHEDLVVDTVERYSPPTNVAIRYWPDLAATKHLTVLLNAPCIEIQLDKDGNRAETAVVGRTATAPATAPPQVRASVFVLAAGGLETARLLLASNKHREKGLGNENDLVGRFYMTHSVGNLGLLSFKERAPHRDMSFLKTADGVYARRNFQVSETARRREGLGAFVLRPSIGRISDPNHGSGVLSAMFLARNVMKHELFTNMARRSVDGESRSALSVYSGHLVNVMREAPSIIAFAHQWYVDRPRQRRKLPGFDFLRRDQTYPLEFNAEQAPNHSSRVYLGDKRDPFGIPLIAVDWRTCEEDRRTVRRGSELIRDALSSTGRAEIVFDEAELEAATAKLWPAGGHHIGTARWSSSPGNGVVGPDMQVWSVKGLYVAGAAIFPRSGSANPTLSAVAVGLRLADCLVTQFLRNPTLSGALGAAERPGR
jgi:choline dehydrogenase-like flavoprotein